MQPTGFEGLSDAELVERIVRFRHPGPEYDVEAWARAKREQSLRLLRATSIIN